ncbi:MULTISPECIES: hypothetical protein [Micromonospora]|nr:MULTISPECIES: hypothetical protein [Micromonospora]NES16158.1 hypothetical protein [Micromonospora sp. PPF5-17B]NES38041.1 hypothetical protein [Micromonospora solifontis]NES57645.1 hypothetical protein [Micromonospora sp. PPF5-6]
MHPTLGELQRYTLNKPLTFRCSRCQRTNMSTSVVTLGGDWSHLLCGRCYGGPVGSGKSVAPLAKAARSSERARPETHRPASPLPRDMVWLAALHRSQAEGKQLSPSEQELHRRRAGEAASIAAIRYAEGLLEIEVRIAELAGGRAAEEPSRTRDELALRRVEASERFRARRHVRSEPASADPRPEPLATQVVREVVGSTFDAALDQVLRRRRLRLVDLETPTTDVWTWLRRHEKEVTPELPAEVKRLRKLSQADFTREAVADVNRWQHDESLAHPAVAEQWAACADDIVAETERAYRSIRADPPGGRGKDVATGLRRAGEAHARASARCLEAQLMVQDLRVQATRIHRARGLSKLRADCLAEAARAVRKNDSDLATHVDRAIEEHRRGCPQRRDCDRQADCVSSIAEAVRFRLAAVELPGTAPLAPRPGVVEGAPSAELAPCGHERGAFICPDLLKQVSTDMARIVGTVDLAYRGEGRFAFAWVTEYGELGTGADQAINEHDAWLQAACRGVLDLGGELSNVHIVCRDERAASVVRYVVHVGLVPDALGFPVSQRTRDLLAALVARSGKTFVDADRCPGPHRGATAAKRLAAVVLEAGPEAGGAQAVKSLADEISDELREMAESRAQPPRPAEAAQWSPAGSEAGEFRWKAAVGLAQISGGWCTLPAGMRTPPTAGSRLRLAVHHPRHAERDERAESDVLVRHVGGKCELHGVVWPPGLLPGTLVTFGWRPGGDAILARTELLPRPERVDELTYRHRYDIRVVVRETAPGAEQEARVPDLSDTGWVMRTLRKLGHLSPDGSAILAEKALVRNCRELGLPQSRVGRIHPAVEDLIRDRRIGRLRGSLDRNGLPSYPPRAGESRVDLLRYVPRVVSIAPHPDHRQEPRPPRRDHWVDGFVRRLPAGAHASAEQIEAHREAIRAAEVVDQPLRDGFTYVRRHRRAR